MPATVPAFPGMSSRAVLAEARALIVPYFRGGHQGLGMKKAKQTSALVAGEQRREGWGECAHVSFSPSRTTVKA